MISQSVEVKPDSDGEERLLIADMVLEVDMKLYREEEHDVVLDVYTPLRQCIPKGKDRDRWKVCLSGIFPSAGC